MTPLEKNIYNTYLKVSRTRSNKPYRFRKNFDSFEDNENYVYVKKLERFFIKFSHIKMEEFFNCPYEVHPDNSAYDLRFYTTPKAVRMYGTYSSQRDNECPDGEYQIKFITDSLMHIFRFCKQHNITVEDYTNHKTNNIHSFIVHMRERQVSFYTLFGFSEFRSILETYPQGQMEFTLGKNIENNLALYKTRYYNSRRAKRVVETGLAKINKLLIKIKAN